MTTTTDGPDVEHVTDADVAKAEREAAEAAQLVDALEERVRDGDQDVTPAHIAAQRDLAHFAQLRAEATRRNADRAKAAAHAQALADLRAQILADVNGGGQGLAAVAQALDSVDRAITKFLTTARQHNAWHAQTRDRLRDLCNTLPSDRGEDAESGLAFADRLSHNEPAVIVVDDQPIEEVGEGDLLAASVYQAVAQHGGLPHGGAGVRVDSMLSMGLTNPAEWYARKRSRLAELAAAAKARRSTR
ncbi:hypothetical protein ACQEVZ_38660 [Dactylosporangium sp. CA-152071]|uniref:hypothetical protein n=1 Tax=Dactylosporangium sp. CA-152071 TaxID=3239933 RepID=UPI003D8CC34E